jgi:hypothetical protein
MSCCQICNSCSEKDRAPLLRRIEDLETLIEQHGYTADQMLMTENKRLREALQTLLNVGDCLCNSIEWDDGLCAHDLARAALEAKP